MVSLIVVAITALAFGILIGWLSGRNSGASLREQLAGVTARLEAAQSQLADLEGTRSRAAQVDADNAVLQTKLDAAQASLEAQAAAATRVNDEMRDQFKLLARDVLKDNSEEFSKRAEEIFKLQKDATAAEIEKRTKDISELVKPLGESLKAYDLALKDIEGKRIADVSAVQTLLAEMKTQHANGMSITANLVNALRAAPKTRGRWGEETLRRVAEMSGLIEHCDFETEKHFRGQDESLRPDMVIHVAGGRSIIVDAKAPVSAYLDAIAATTEEERDVQLQRHALQLRERLKNLSSKSYTSHFHGSVDCVVMFVPGDNFVSAAFERDPQLFEDGVNARVLICTPTTFIALTKAISYGWRQDKLAQNALDVGRLGKELYVRLSAMGKHIVALGKNLGGAVEKYNDMVGSLETSVMPKARSFQALGVEGISEALPEPKRVETVVRFPQSGRDLLVSGNET